MKRIIALLALTAVVAVARGQQTTEVKEFRLAGPFAVSAPIAFDTVDVKGKAFDPQSLLSSVSHDIKATSTCPGNALLPSLADSRGVGVLSFYVNNTSFLNAKLNVKGPKTHKLFVDGTEASPDLKLAPEHHTIAIKYLVEPSDSDSICVSIEAPQAVDYTLSEKHPYMVHDLFDGRRVRGISLSPDGRYVCLSWQTTRRDGSSQWSYELRDAATQRLISTPSQQPQWMPRTAAIIEEELEQGDRVLYKTDPLTGQRQRWTAGVPQGWYTVSPTEDYIIINVEEEGTKEDDDVFQVLEMDDRQPDWRKRKHLVRHDVATGVSQRITFGAHTVSLHDISADGSTLLLFSYRSRLEKRPTSVSDVFLMDQKTLKVDTLFTGLEFVESAEFSPDAKQILFKGTPEAFQRIGCQLPADKYPSMTENELFIYDIATKKVRAMTRDFDPSILQCNWSKADGHIYFHAEDRDYQRLFRLDPVTGSIRPLDVPGDYVYRWSQATNTPVLAYTSYDTMAPASAYVVHLVAKKQKADVTCFFDGHEALGDAQLGNCQDWNFTNSKGDTVYGRLYLPDGFDPSKKYPMIVYYYGGCSPVGRYFESPYAPQMWNSLGYIAYIPQPSGATGFGQEWASRHVNTAGQGPAEDIIEGVKRLCAEHPYINKEKIGCMGASYGGFMTQYLQTVTDIFACAVSHAGIANHTSYWGEGYWGYNYSEVSMAGSYPWSHRKLYVDQSPLFNADKIHTPLLLLHGNADTNVPLIESLQMFTALKLLGREVALVEVKGENHHIQNYKKREKWLATQMAWFQRWLKDDPTWWDALYPRKNL